MAGFRFLTTSFLVLLFGICVYAGRPRFLKEVKPKEKHEFKAWLEKSAFFFSWIGQLYYVLPGLSFAMTEDWAVVFFDCLTPVSLWFDVVNSSAILLVNLFLVNKLDERSGLTSSKNAGIVGLFASLYHYLTLKTQMGQVTQEEARKQLIAAVVMYPLITLVLQLQLQFKWYLPGFCHSDLCQNLFGTLAVMFIMTSVACEIGQIVASIAFRWAEDKWEDDERPIYWVKVSAAAFVFLSAGFEIVDNIWLKGYFDEGFIKTVIVLMPIVSTSCALLLIIARSIGPRQLVDFLEWTWKSLCTCGKGIRRGCSKAGEAIVEGGESVWKEACSCCEALAGGLSSAWKSACNWCKAVSQDAASAEPTNVAAAVSQDVESANDSNAAGS